MSDWKGHATIADFGRSARVTVGRPTGRIDGSYEVVEAFGESGNVVIKMSGGEGVTPDHMEIPLDIAEALYKALDHIFGYGTDAGTVAQLKKEQDRVDLVLNTLLNKENHGN